MSPPMPQEPLDALGLELTVELCMRRHRASVVLGGTKVMQHSSGGGGGATHATKATNAAATTSRLPIPPGGGAVGFVLRTGFLSSQGGLIR